MIVCIEVAVPGCGAAWCAGTRYRGVLAGGRAGQG